MSMTKLQIYVSKEHADYLTKKQFEMRRKDRKTTLDDLIKEIIEYYRLKST